MLVGATKDSDAYATYPGAALRLGIPLEGLRKDKAVLLLDILS